MVKKRGIGAQVFPFCTGNYVLVASNLHLDKGLFLSLLWGSKVESSFEKRKQHPKFCLGRRSYACRHMNILTESIWD